MKAVKSETNPRWESAQFEEGYIFYHCPDIPKPIPPLRFESREDWDNQNPIPPFLVTYDDGHTEEHW